MAYETSALYKQAIEKEVRVTFIDGEIKATNGLIVKVTNDMISTSSFYITNQCVNSDAFEYGSVFTAELGITLRTEIDRYILYGAEVKLFFNILVEEIEFPRPKKVYERIPLGVFYVNEPNRVGRNISIKAYDKMTDLEEGLAESITGTAYELLVYIASRCNVTLAQSKEEVDKLTNSEILLTASIEQVSTYRELLSYICLVTCTFAAFDKNGKLKLYEFSSTPSKRIEAKSRTASKFSDFETFFSGVKCELFFADNYKPYTQTNGGSGVIYDMGSIPIVHASDMTNQGIVANISLKTSHVKYVPCDVSFSGDPSIELGDLIVNVDRSGNEHTSLVTFYRWTYRGSHQIKSAGQNPKLLKAKDKSSREISILRNDISSKDVSVYTYTNASDVEIQGVEMQEIALVSFSAKKASTCMIMVTIPIEMSMESDVEFRQILDGSEMMGGLIAQRCHEGFNTITFVNYFSTEANSIHKYTIVGVTKGINGGEAGALAISAYALKAIVFGQGLASVVQWDGSIKVGDSIPLIEVMNEVSVTSLKENVELVTNTYSANQVSDRVRSIKVSGHVFVEGFSDIVEATIEN